MRSTRPIFGVNRSISDVAVTFARYMGFNVPSYWDQIIVAVPPLADAQCIISGPPPQSPVKCHSWIVNIDFNLFREGAGPKSVNLKK